MFSGREKFSPGFVAAALFFAIFSWSPAPLAAQTASKASQPGRSSTNVVSNAPVATPTPAVESNTPFYQDPTQVKSEGPGYAWLLFRTIFILALFGLTAWLLWRWLRNRPAAKGAVDGPMALVHDFPLGVQKSLKVIRVVNEFYLVGVGQDGVRLIAKLEDQETIDTFRLQEERSGPATASFGEALARVLPGFSGPNKKPLDFTRALRDRLGKMGK